MSPVKKAKVTLQISTIIAILALLGTLHWRFQTAANADKAAAVAQENRDSGQDGQISTNLRQLDIQGRIHREDISEIRSEMREEWGKAQRRHEEIIDKISQARGR